MLWKKVTYRVASSAVTDVGSIHRLKSASVPSYMALLVFVATMFLHPDGIVVMTGVASTVR